tara:strand:+ start:601 stop:1023 length:423 start_codon:yes stop_codon:yes gene_type:complete
MQKKKSKKGQKNSTTNTKKVSKGLGDTVEKIFKKTGIDKVAKWLLGEDCGCESRKQSLNQMFPYNRVECLIETEYNYLDAYFSQSRNDITYETRKELTDIFNRVFNARSEVYSCGSCFQNEILSKLKKLYDEYQLDKKQE